MAWTICAWVIWVLLFSSCFFFGLPFKLRILTGLIGQCCSNCELVLECQRFLKNKKKLKKEEEFTPHNIWHEMGGERCAWMLLPSINRMDSVSDFNERKKVFFSLFTQNKNSGDCFQGKKERMSSGNREEIEKKRQRENLICVLSVPDMILFIQKGLVPQRSCGGWVWYTWTSHHGPDFDLAHWRSRFPYPSVLTRLSLLSLGFWGHLPKSTDSVSCCFITTWSHGIMVAIATPSVLLTQGYKLSGRKQETDVLNQKKSKGKKWLQTYHSPQLKTSIDYKSAATRKGEETVLIKHLLCTRYHARGLPRFLM